MLPEYIVEFQYEVSPGGKLALAAAAGVQGAGGIPGTQLSALSAQVRHPLWWGLRKVLSRECGAAWLAAVTQQSAGWHCLCTYC